MNIKLVSDKYRPIYEFEGVLTGVKVKKTNVDGTIVSRLINDKDFCKQLTDLLTGGYVVEVRE